MFSKNKAFRYYYWLTIEFSKKHVKLILLSFFLSFFLIVTFISFFPYLNSLISEKNEVIGIVGNYNLNNLPEEILTKISYGLVYQSDKGEILPALSSSWSVSKQGKEFTFHLKKNLNWDDGKKFISKDINYNFKDVTSKPIDDYTIQFELNKPLPIFINYLTRPVVKKPLHGVVGLYKVDRVKTKFGDVREIYLSPNKKELSFIVYKFYENENKLVSAYKTGEINKMTIYKKSTADVFKNWKNTEIIKSVDYSQVLTLFLNTKKPPFSERDFRQAVALAIPRAVLTEFGELAHSPIPPNSWAHNPAVKKITFDPDTARKTLEKSDEGTSSARLEFITFYDYLNIADLINSQFRKVGLKTDLNLSSFERPDKFDMLLAFLKLPSDPDQYFFWHSTQNRSNISGYKNVKVDKLLEDGRGTSSIEERKQAYFQFQKALMEDLPAVFLYHPYVYTIRRK